MSENELSRSSSSSQLFEGRKPRIAILYHYMFPDDVVSALHLDGLAIDLASKGWEVEALPCNRGCRDESRKYASSEFQEGVRYNRVWRPRFRQASIFGRLANSLWMMIAWTRLALRTKKRTPDVVLIGTDPIFAVAAAIPLKLFAPKIRIAHWCFDLHPEAAQASGMVSSSGFPIRVLRKIMSAGYRRCDIIADIGPCMRMLLRQYRHRAREVELTPWALAEPKRISDCDAGARAELFGRARLAVLYSGNFGEAHSFEDILTVARSLRDEPDIHFCFAVRGNRAEELVSALSSEDKNITIAGFAPLEELEKRLGAADIHMASLRPEWSGVAVPSKFFGSLATGRPVLFAGPSESAIAQWINRFDVGIVIAADHPKDAAEKLRHLAKSPEKIAGLQRRAYDVYKSKFARNSVTSAWHTELSNLLARND